MTQYPAPLPSKAAYSAIASEAEMAEGYRDGGDPDSPEPGSNRSEAYTHGFANGRDDLSNRPRASAAVLRGQADAILSGNNSDDPS